MPYRKTPIEPEIARRLQNARFPGSSNQITSAKFRDWAVGYLQRRDESLEKAPSGAGHAHWNLIMIDGELEHAFFAALCFYPHPRGLEFFCGTGNSFAVRHFCEHDAPSDPGVLYAAMEARFRLPQRRLRVNRNAAKEWLGRGWL